jgi:hypothetical protein
MPLSRSNELTRGTIELDSSALSFIGGVHISERALLAINLIWFDLTTSLVFPKGGGGGYFTTCLRSALRGRGGGSAPCGPSPHEFS